jgi:hypothetical protein
LKKKLAVIGNSDASRHPLDFTQQMTRKKNRNAVFIRQQPATDSTCSGEAETSSFFLLNRLLLHYENFFFERS